MSSELVNRIATTFLRSEDVDVKETALYLLQFIIQLDRRSFEKQEVEKCVNEVSYVLLFLMRRCCLLFGSM